MLDTIHFSLLFADLTPYRGQSYVPSSFFLKPVFVIVYVLEFVTSSTRTDIGDQCLCYVIFSIGVLFFKHLGVKFRITFQTMTQTSFIVASRQ